MSLNVEKSDNIKRSSKILEICFKGCLFYLELVGFSHVREFQLIRKVTSLGEHSLDKECDQPEQLLITEAFEE